MFLARFSSVLSSNQNILWGKGPKPIHRYLSESATRHGFHEDCEKAINDQINQELSAGYLYLSMASVFKRDTVALPGFHAMFAINSSEEIEHAMKLVNYQSLRGGHLKLEPIQPPKEIDWEPSTALDASLQAEKDVLDSLLNISRKAQEHGDQNLEDFIVTYFLPEQFEALKTLGDLITQLKLVQGGSGLYLLDTQILKTYGNKVKK